MATAILVSEQRFKQWTQVDSNVRTEDITPFIIQAGDIAIQNTLGTLFYTRLKNGIIANDLTVDEKTLLNDYIAQPVMQYALYLMLPSLKYKIVDKGVLNGVSEDTQATTLEELKYIRQSTLDTYEFYMKRLREYLIDNPGMFNEYTNPGSDGMYPDKSNPYFSGLVTPHGPRNNPTGRPNCDECNDTTSIY
jgi:hypothetical protein